MASPPPAPVAALSAAGVSPLTGSKRPAALSSYPSPPPQCPRLELAPGVGDAIDAADGAGVLVMDASMRAAAGASAAPDSVPELRIIFIDASGSMGTSEKKASVAAVLDGICVETSGDALIVALSEFGTTSVRTKSAADWSTALSKIYPDNNTLLWESIANVVATTHAAGVEHVTSIVIISDGEDNCSKGVFAGPGGIAAAISAIDAAGASSARLFLVGVEHEFAPEAAGVSAAQLARCVVANIATGHSGKRAARAVAAAVGAAARRALPLPPAGEMTRIHAAAEGDVPDPGASAGIIWAPALDPAAFVRAATVATANGAAAGVPAATVQTDIMRVLRAMATAADTGIVVHKKVVDEPRQLSPDGARLFASHVNSFLYAAAREPATGIFGETGAVKAHGSVPVWRCSQPAALANHLVSIAASLA